MPLQLIRETIRFMFVRVVGKNSGESARLICKSTAVGGVEDYLSIKGQLIQEIGLESDDSDLISGYTVLK